MKKEKINPWRNKEFKRQMFITAGGLGGIAASVPLVVKMFHSEKKRHQLNYLAAAGATMMAGPFVGNWAHETHEKYLAKRNKIERK